LGRLFCRVTRAFTRTLCFKKSAFDALASFC
jgi:hypothetical protein